MNIDGEQAQDLKAYCLLCMKQVDDLHSHSLECHIKIKAEVYEEGIVDFQQLSIYDELERLERHK